MVRSKIKLTVGRLPLRPFLPFAILSSFSDLVLFSSSLLHRVFPWLFYRRQPDHRGPPPGAEAGWLRDFSNRRPFAGGATLGDPGPHPAGSSTAPPSSACRGAGLGRPLAIIPRASAIADYTDTSVFAPEVDDNGVAQPEEWFGLNPEYGEDSAEEIDSSDEGEEEEEEGEDAELAGGAAGQPQPDRTSSTTSRASASAAVGGGQAETR